LAAALGSLLGISTESGGWILGGTITIAFFFAGMIIASALHASGPVAGVSLSGSLAIGMGLGTLFGWLPIWFIFFVFVFALISVIGLLPNRGSS
jgi:hypothetical protein